MTPTLQEAPVATSKQYLDFLVSAKAYAATAAGLVATVATALLAVYGPDTPVGHVLVVAAAAAGAVLTFVTTYKVPNLTVEEAEDDEFDVSPTEFDGEGGIPDETL